MQPKVITAVATEPVTAAEAKLHLGIDDISGSHPDDSLITVLIGQAREYAEKYTGKALAAQTLEAALDCFPDSEDDRIRLPMPPVASITHVKYTDTAGVEQTITSAAYSLSTYGDSRMLQPTFGNYWPTTQDIPDAVRIRYVTGYGAPSAGAEFTAIPKAAKQAILIQISLTYPRQTMSPQERQQWEKARDDLLNTVKDWSRA
jgi:uncharacterized phiE125 gp8 family phage protein